MRQTRPPHDANRALRMTPTRGNEIDSRMQGPHRNRRPAKESAASTDSSPHDEPDTRNIPSGLAAMPRPAIQTGDRLRGSDAARKRQSNKEGS
jgi:hypothetical protein